MVKITFRIYTEHKNNLAELTAKYFDGFTLLNAIGYWRNLKEKSAIIEIATNNKKKVLELCNKIKQTNKQQSILLQEYTPTTTFI